MTDEEMEADQERKLQSIGGYEAEKLRMERDAAEQAYQALLERGQLSTQTEAEWQNEQNNAKQEWLNKQVAINEAYVKNEQAKAQAARAVSNSLISLLEAVGEEGSAAAKMAKVIALAQIAIDTGKALSAGIASASAVPFPGNLVAIAQPLQLSSQTSLRLFPRSRVRNLPRVVKLMVRGQERATVYPQCSLTASM